MATYKPLSTDFKDDILASQNSKRKYTQVNNSDGTVSFQDSTAYSQVGSSYGAKEVIEEREAINNIYANKLVSLDEIDLVTEPGFFVDAQVVKELNSNKIKRPDFSNVNRISWNGTSQRYTFTEDCYINVSNAHSKTYGYGCELKINSVFLIHTTGNDASTWQSIFVMVSKGDVLTCNDYFAGDIDIIGTK